MTNEPLECALMFQSLSVVRATREMPLLSTYYNFLVRGIDKTNKGNQMRRQSCTHQTIFSFFSGKADSIYRVIVKPNEPSFLFFCFFFSATHTQHQHLMWRCVYRTESKWDKRFKVLRSWSSACQVRHIVFRRTREMRNTAIHSDMMILDSRWICNRRPNKNLSTLRLVGKLNKVEKKNKERKRAIESVWNAWNEWKCELRSIGISHHRWQTGFYLLCVERSTIYSLDKRATIVILFI